MARSIHRLYSRSGPPLSRFFSAILCTALFLVGGSSSMLSAADSFAIIAGRAFLGHGPESEVERVAIVIREGVITSVTTDLESLDPHLPRVEFPDGYLTSGLIAAATDIGGSRRGEESVGAGYRAVDGFDRYGDYRPWLASGVTTAHVSPGEHKLLSGEGAVVKLAGPPARRVIVDRSDLCFQLGDPADGPAPLIEFPFPPSSDVAIEPAKRQRPTTRLGRLLAIEEELAATLEGSGGGGLHPRALAEAWSANRPLRISAERAVDLLAAISFIRGKDRVGSIVGGREAQRVASSLAESGIPLIYRPQVKISGSARDLGFSFEGVYDDLPDFNLLRREGVDLVLAPPRNAPVTALRFSAILAHRHGLDRSSALRAITSNAARAIGLENRLGAIAPGRDADLVLWSDDPLSLGARPLEVIVAGKRVFRPSPVTGVETTAVVVRAGTIWVSPQRRITDGEVLIESGEVVAVGHSVSRPPFAKVIDAGPDAFVTPGFIDARGHLGLRGDQGAAGLDVRFGSILGVPSLPEERVATAGITTVLLSPYRFSKGGSPFAAVKTWGELRSDRLIREVAAVAFEVQGDPISFLDGLEGSLSKGKNYLKKWQKYEKQLAEWREKIAKGETIKPTEQVEEVVEGQEDPITGVWSGTVSGGPLPEPQPGKMSLVLKGTSIEGRIVDPPVPVEHRIVATLDGTKISGTIEADVDLPASPMIEAELVAEDSIEGTISVMGFSIDLEANRISKEAMEYKVTRRKRVREDGRPIAPVVDPALEPLRRLLEKQIPAVIRVNGREQIARTLELMVDREELPLILLDAQGSLDHLERLVKSQVGVILPMDVLIEDRDRRVNPSDLLARHGVPIAFQSGAADGAVDLPMRALYAVDHGLAADAAIAALTTDVARMFRIEDRVGSLEPGCDGDLLIFRGHPFRGEGRLERVLIRGEEVAQ